MCHHSPISTKTIKALTTWAGAKAAAPERRVAMVASFIMVDFFIVSDVTVWSE
jgi:hypothetical protein